MPVFLENAPPPTRRRSSKTEKKMDIVCDIYIDMCVDVYEKSSIIIFKPYTVCVHIYIYIYYRLK